MLGRYETYCSLTIVDLCAREKEATKSGKAQALESGFQLEKQ